MTTNESLTALASDVIGMTHDAQRLRADLDRIPPARTVDPRLHAALTSLFARHTGLCSGGER